LCTKKSPGKADYCGSSTCANDVGFISALLDHLSDMLCVDEQRVHATGMSNGAIFLYYLATTEVGKILASIMPVEGSLMLGHAGTPLTPMPLMDIHGIYDDTVPANVSNSWRRYKKFGCPVKAAGAEGCAVSNDGWYYTPQGTLLSPWARANACQSGSVSAFVTDGRFDGQTGFDCVTETAHCANPVIRCVHSVRYNGGHTWPFHEGQPHWPRSPVFGELFWWFASRFRRADSSPAALSDSGGAPVVV